MVLFSAEMTGMTITETEIEAGITVINMIDVISMMDHQKLKESSEKIQLGGELVFKMGIFIK